MLKDDWPFTFRLQSFDSLQGFSVVYQSCEIENCGEHFMSSVLLSILCRNCERLASQ